ncbi:MAG: hypothetical protein GY950_35890, partial [bacterium]|nr:hypothetical protein [bacterium]
MKKIMLIAALAAAAVLITGCGTVKKVNIQSNPPNALVMVHENENVDESFFVDYCDPTPGLYSVNLWGKEKIRYVTAEKRGFRPATQAVTKETGPQLSFDLQPIEGVPEKVFKKENLLSGTFDLLPVRVDVKIHSGIGALGKQKFNPELSDTVSENFYNALGSAVKENQRIYSPPIQDEGLLEEWGGLSGKLKDFASKLNIKRLDYYGTPPYIEKKVDGFKGFTGKLVNGNGKPSDYLLYIWGKCVSETKGRKTGNILMGLLGAAMHGVNPTMYYNPSAFNPTTGTLVVLYVIDAATSEVLYIEPIYFRRDISKDKGMAAVVDVISQFPQINENKEKTAKKKK